MTNTCKQCNSDYEAKRATSLYCSSKCRVKAGRLSVTDDSALEPVSVTNEELSVTKVSVTELSVTDVSPSTPSEPEAADSRHYATRTNPDTLNTGEWMTSDELHQAGLKANRMPIPGDHDYTGACECVGGKVTA